MPDINPIAGDLVEISITVPNGTLTTITAQMKTKETDGKWAIELAGDPPLRGKIDIAQYEWHQEIRQWKKVSTKAELPRAMTVAVGMGSSGGGNTASSTPVAVTVVEGWNLDQQPAPVR